MNVNGTTTNFSYDDWGRMAGKTQGSYAATYGYRFGDKLKSVTSSFPGEAPSVGYNYDGLGKRRVEQLGTSTITWFRWLGMEESGEYTGTPGTWTIGAMQTGYVPGLATFAGANPTTAEWRYHLTDHLGSVRQLSGQNKAALARYDYAPYGELSRSSGLPLTVGYTGHRWDPEIGQYFAPFRYYNPQIARWNMRDPLGFVDGPNVYAYVAGNPVNNYDPLGLSALPMDPSMCWPLVKPALPITLNALVAGLGAFGGLGYLGTGASTILAILGSPVSVPVIITGITIGTVVGIGGAIYYKAHTKGAHKATKAKHEKGERRKKRDQGGEGGDDPNKRPYYGPGKRCGRK